MPLAPVPQAHMDLRITTAPSGVATLVTIAGRLAGESTAELGRVVGEIDGDIRLDLAELRAAEGDGLALLRRLLAKGARLERASPYIRLVLELDAC